MPINQIVANTLVLTLKGQNRGMSHNGNTLRKVLVPEVAYFIYKYVSTNFYGFFEYL